MDEDIQSEPETAADMLARWAQRDAEYAKRRAPLSVDEIEAIIMGRAREAGRLPVADRARMFGKAKTWDPPKPPDYGSMKDWLDD